jgi:hypothetical protein
MFKFDKKIKKYGVTYKTLLIFCNYSVIYKRFLSTFGMTIPVSYQGGRLRRPPFFQLKARVIPNVERNLCNTNCYDKIVQNYFIIYPAILRD